MLGQYELLENPVPLEDGDTCASKLVKQGVYARYPPGRFSKKAKLSEEEERALPGCGEWAWPPSGPSAVRDSLRVHARGHVDATPPPQTTIDEAVRWLCESGEYPETEVPAWCSYDNVQVVDGPKDGSVHFLSDGELERAYESVLSHVVPDSTPGVPFMSLGHTNKDVMTKYPDFLRGSVFSSLRAAVFHGDAVFRMTPWELVENGIRDPVRLFIKDEPHKASKFASGKFRLISGVSLRDQIKERLLCGGQNSAEILKWRTCPSKPGIGLDDDGLREMSAWFAKQLVTGDLCETDVSGWDWSVQEWELFADAECRRRLAHAERGSLFDFLLRVQAYSVSRTVFVIPGGCMYAQLFPGVQLSGSYNTSSSNSRMRILASLVGRIQSGVEPRGELAIAAMGDDCVERHYPGVDECLGKLGHTIKNVVIDRTLEGVEFCSHRWFSNGLAELVPYHKTLFRYFSHPEGSASYLDWYTQLAWVLRNNRDRQFEQVAFARAERANNLIVDGATKEQQSSQAPTGAK